MSDELVKRILDPAPPPDPRDYTARFNTALTPEEEQQFQQYVQQKKLGTTHSYDYDMRGAWKSDVKQAANGHYPDTFKKPNHPTFSSGSQYSTPATPGGEWQDLGDGKWKFTASPAQLKLWKPEELQSYFATREKGNQLVLPGLKNVANGTPVR
jgi:hypothetical protein